MFRPIKPESPRPGQESVWDYPRPPRLEPTDRRLRVEFAGLTLAETIDGWRVLETSHPPVYFFPREDVRMELLTACPRTTYCEWKGLAKYFDIAAAGRRAFAAAWTYPDPERGYEPIRDMICFYPRMMDACWVDDEQATPQPGGFYGGWVTSDVVGPFKGEPGTEGW